MNRLEFDKEFEKLALAFGTDLKPDRINFYFKTFSKTPPHIFAHLVNACLENDKTFPAISSLKKYENDAYAKFKRETPDNASEPVLVRTEHHYADGQHELHKLIQANADKPNVKKMLEGCLAGFLNAKAFEQGHPENQKINEFVQRAEQIFAIPTRTTPDTDYQDNPFF